MDGAWDAVANTAAHAQHTLRSGDFESTEVFRLVVQRRVQISRMSTPTGLRTNDVAANNKCHSLRRSYLKESWSNMNVKSGALTICSYILVRRPLGVRMRDILESDNQPENLCTSKKLARCS